MSRRLHLTKSTCDKNRWHTLYLVCSRCHPRGSVNTRHYENESSRWRNHTKQSAMLSDSTAAHRRPYSWQCPITALHDYSCARDHPQVHSTSNEVMLPSFCIKIKTHVWASVSFCTHHITSGVSGYRGRIHTPCLAAHLPHLNPHTC